jgi:hypothetical protein
MATASSRIAWVMLSAVLLVKTVPPAAGSIEMDRRATIAAPAARAGIDVRNVGPSAGLPEERHSWSVLAYDIDHDGWDDLTIGHHGQAVTVYRNEHAGGRSLGFTKVVTLWDTVHGWDDPHACDWADVNGDGLDDLFCTTGADQGTTKKWNQLWIQDPAWKFTNRARTWSVEDVWGRGRYPTFLDINHDEWPDLFIGNDFPRTDGRLSPNRTFLNVDGERFRQASLGITREIGANCVEVTDVNRDGWDDLLVCGNAGLTLYVRQPATGFIERRAAYGLTSAIVHAARIVDVSGDGRRDLVAVTTDRLLVQLRRVDGTFAPASISWPLARGHGLAVGDIDGQHGPDIFVVQACSNEVNVPDVLLLNNGMGTAWAPFRGLPGPVPGCGDVADDLDFDHDGRRDFVVLNGGYIRDSDVDIGPDQLLTTGPWHPPA